MRREHPNQCKTVVFDTSGRGTLQGHPTGTPTGSRTCLAVLSLVAVQFQEVEMVSQLGEVYLARTCTYGCMTHLPPRHCGEGRLSLSLSPTPPPPAA